MTEVVTKVFDISSFVLGLELINGGKKVIIAEENGKLSIVDLETMQISQNQEIKLQGGNLFSVVLM